MWLYWTPQQLMGTGYKIYSVYSAGCRHPHTDYLGHSSLFPLILPATEAHRCQKLIIIEMFILCLLFLLNR